MINNAVQLLMCLLAICMSSLEKCPFKSYPWFWIGLFCCWVEEISNGILANEKLASELHSNLKHPKSMLYLLPVQLLFMKPHPPSLRNQHLLWEILPSELSPPNLTTLWIRSYDTALQFVWIQHFSLPIYLFTFPHYEFFNGRKCRFIFVILGHCLKDWH